MVSRLDLVSQAELERQEIQLHEAKRTINVLMQRLDQLEAKQGQSTP